MYRSRKAAILATTATNSCLAEVAIAHLTIVMFHGNIGKLGFYQGTSPFLISPRQISMGHFPLLQVWYSLVAFPYVS